MTRKRCTYFFCSKCSISTFDRSIFIQRKLYSYANDWSRNMTYIYCIVDDIGVYARLQSFLSQYSEPKYMIQQKSPQRAGDFFVYSGVVLDEYYLLIKLIFPSFLIICTLCSFSLLPVSSTEKKRTKSALLYDAVNLVQIFQGRYPTL